MAEVEARRRFETPIVAGLRQLGIAHRVFADVVESSECPVRVQIDLEQSEDSIAAFDVLAQLDAPRHTKVELETNLASTSMLFGEIVDGTA